MKKLKKKTETNHTMRWKILKFFFFSVACGNNINEIKLWKSTYRSLLIIGVRIIKKIPEIPEALQSTTEYPRIRMISIRSHKRWLMHQFPHKQLYLYIWYIYVNCIRIGCYKYATPLPESITGIVSAPSSPQLGSTVK